MITIPGQKILLRDWQLQDLPAQEYWLQPGRRWKDFDAPYHPGPAAAEIPALIAAQRMAIEQGRLPIPRASLAIARRNDDALLGLVTQLPIPQLPNVIEAGTVIYDPQHWGRGYGREATGLWCGHLWLMIDTLQEIRLHIWAGNSAALTVAARLGFRERPTLDRTIIEAGRSYHERVWTISRTGWFARYPAGAP
jgi:RimJ/RimL family protein N-acetyltransferase